MKGQILYFERSGKRNTEDTLQAARQRVQELGIAQIVVASTHGYTAKRAKEVFDGLGVVVIAFATLGMMLASSAFKRSLK